MTTIRKTITLTDKQDQWIKSQIANGDYTNDSEYFRDLIRRDQQHLLRSNALRLAIQQGLDSGQSDRSIADIWQEAEKRHAADNA